MCRAIRSDIFPGRALGDPQAAADGQRAGPAEAPRSPGAAALLHVRRRRILGAPQPQGGGRATGRRRHEGRARHRRRRRRARSSTGAERLAALVAEAPEVRAAAAGTARWPARWRRSMRAGKLTGYRGHRRARRRPRVERRASRRSGRRSPPEVLPRPPPSRARGRRARGCRSGRSTGGCACWSSRRCRAVRASSASASIRRELSAPLLAARAGRTGETYAFDAPGADDLQQPLSRSTCAGAGLIGPDEDDSALRVEIRDPGGDTDRGLSRRDAAARRSR